MKLLAIRKILDAAMANQQRGIIKYGNDSVDFDFTAGDSSEQDMVAFSTDTEVLSVFGKARNAYIDCEAIQCIEVYR
ncbi:MAG: hypothetical protein PUE15_10785 [Prevotella sp.]|nr:hypothetical protein [Prevotella sp.]